MNLLSTVSKNKQGWFVFIAILFFVFFLTHNAFADDRLIAAYQSDGFSDVIWINDVIGGLNPADWKSVNIGSGYGDVPHLAASTDGSGKVFFAGEKIFTSSNRGESWIQRGSAGVASWNAISSSADGMRISAVNDSASTPGYVVTSIDGGSTWVTRTSAGQRWWRDVVVNLSDGTKIAALYYDTTGSYIYYSSDGGTTWASLTTAGKMRWSSVAMSADGSRLIASVGTSRAAIPSATGYIYTSSDGGTTWTQRTSAGQRYWANVASSADGMMLVASTYDSFNGGGVFISRDSGSTWQLAYNIAGQEISMTPSGDKIALASYAWGIAASIDGGQNWTRLVGVLNGTSEWTAVAWVSSAPSCSSGWTQTGNPSNMNESARGIAVDAAGVYIVGDDYSPGNGQWRIEKRDPTTGNLIPGFGVGGIVAENPSTLTDLSYAIAVDQSAIYVAGYDVVQASLNWRWRIEKRNKVDGGLFNGSDAAHSPVFGTGGVIMEGFSNYGSRPSTIAVDATGIYVAGWDNSRGSFDSQWRIEKRSLTTGALLSTFGSGGAVTVNTPTANSVDQVYSIAVNSGGIYGVGIGDTLWRLEKRDLTTGALIAGFGSGGKVTGTGGAFPGLTLDSTGVYIGGWDYVPGNAELRIEKRDLTTGSLMPSFGVGGIVQSNPTSQLDLVYALGVDNTGLYVGGIDSLPSITSFEGGKWRVEKRNPVTGDLISSFGTGGVITENPGSANAVFTMAADGMGAIYLAGLDSSPGNYQWRIQKIGSGYLDIGLRLKEPTQIVKIAACPAGSPVRIVKDGVTYSIVVVPITDPNASMAHVKLPDGTVRALRKYP